MNINNGEILSLVSIPDFNLNSRKNISDVNYINRATKGVYELGSVFKSFTIAAGLDYGLISPNDMFLNLEKKLKCGGRIISEYDEKLSKDLSVEVHIDIFKQYRICQNWTNYWSRKIKKIFRKNWNFEYFKF